MGWRESCGGWSKRSPRRLGLGVVEEEEKKGGGSYHSLLQGEGVGRMRLGCAKPCQGTEQKAKHMSWNREKCSAEGDQMLEEALERDEIRVGQPCLTELCTLGSRRVAVGSSHCVCPPTIQEQLQP